MTHFDDLVHEVHKKLIKLDEDDRKSKKLHKSRSEIEAIQYRMDFDITYDKFTNDFINATLHSYGAFPKPASEMCSLVDSIPIDKMHDFIGDEILLPYAIAKAIDYKTNSGGKITDIGKVCNLYTFSSVFAHEFKISENELFQTYKKFMIWSKENNWEVFFSKTSMVSSIFFYWLIYDHENKALDLNLLIDLSEASKGSFVDFKTGMVVLCLMKRNPVSTKEDLKSIINTIRDKW